MRKPLLVLLVLLSLSLPVLTATPATANSYPGLHQQQWISPYDDILRARIAIEVNDSGQGRYRFRIQCFYIDANGRLIAANCLMGPGKHTWKDLTTGETFSKSPPDEQFDTDQTWVGTYRTLRDNHTYAVKAEGFLVYFYRSEYVSQQHTICSYRVTWHTGRSPTIGSLWCNVP
jgi:hypothetical protein